MLINKQRPHNHGFPAKCVILMGFYVNSTQPTCKYFQLKLS